MSVRSKPVLIVGPGLAGLALLLALAQNRIKVCEAILEQEMVSLSCETLTLIFDPTTVSSV
jgi:2-polyprenyl-6-methoxyphenol hydroxylase-like FAD-dependent oxidoreductase